MHAISKGLLPIVVGLAPLATAGCSPKGGCDAAGTKMLTQ